MQAAPAPTQAAASGASGASDGASVRATLQFLHLAHAGTGRCFRLCTHWMLHQERLECESRGPVRLTAPSRVVLHAHHIPARVRFRAAQCNLLNDVTGVDRHAVVQCFREHYRRCGPGDPCLESKSCGCARADGGVPHHVRLSDFVKEKLMPWAVARPTAEERGLYGRCAKRGDTKVIAAILAAEGIHVATNKIKYQKGWYTAGADASKTLFIQPGAVFGFVPIEGGVGAANAAIAADGACNLAGAAGAAPVAAGVEADVSSNGGGAVGGLHVAVVPTAGGGPMGVSGGAANGGVAASNGAAAIDGAADRAPVMCPPVSVPILPLSAHWYDLCSFPDRHARSPLLVMLLSTPAVSCWLAVLLTL